MPNLPSLGAHRFVNKKFPASSRKMGQASLPVAQAISNKIASTENPAIRVTAEKVRSPARCLPRRSGPSTTSLDAGGASVAMVLLGAVGPAAVRQPGYVIRRDEGRSTDLDLGELGDGLVLDRLRQRSEVEVRQRLLAVGQQVV